MAGRAVDAKMEQTTLFLFFPFLRGLKTLSIASYIYIGIYTSIEYNTHVQGSSTNPTLIRIQKENKSRKRKLS